MCARVSRRNPEVRVELMSYGALILAVIVEDNIVSSEDCLHID
jgi:hypothetical protein